jgi:hypothetical protein
MMSDEAVERFQLPERGGGGEYDEKKAEKKQATRPEKERTT